MTAFTGTIAGLTIGLATGAAFYAGLWWNVRLLRDQAHWLKIALLTSIRGALVVAALVAIARHGPTALAAATAGLVLARHGACRMAGGWR